MLQSRTPPLWKLITIFCLTIFTTVWLSNHNYTINAQTVDLENKEVLTIAVKNNSPPLGFLNSEGELQGLEIDIAKRLAKELLGSESKLKLLPVTNQERLDVVMNGVADLAIAKMTLNNGRSQLVDFSPYYYLDGTGIISKNQQIKQTSDLTTKKIAVLNQSTTIPVIRAKLPQANLVGVDSYQEAYQLLESGQVQAFAADQSTLTGWIKEYPDYYFVSQHLSGEPLAIVMPKGLQYRNLRNQVNQAIALWRDSGWLLQRATYWGLP